MDSQEDEPLTHAEIIRQQREQDDLWFRNKFLPIAVPAGILLVLLIIGWAVLGFWKGTGFIVGSLAAIAAGFFVFHFVCARVKRHLAEREHETQSVQQARPISPLHSQAPAGWAPPYYSQPSRKEATFGNGTLMTAALLVIAVILGGAFFYDWQKEHASAPSSSKQETRSTSNESDALKQEAERLAEERRALEEREQAVKSAEEDRKRREALEAAEQERAKEAERRKAEDAKREAEKVPPYVEVVNQWLKAQYDGGLGTEFWVPEYRNISSSLIGVQKWEVKSHDKSKVDDFATVYVRVWSTNKGGVPIIVDWSIAVTKVNGKWYIMNLLNSKG